MVFTEQNERGVSFIISEIYIGMKLILEGQRKKKKCGRENENQQKML